MPSSYSSSPENRFSRQGFQAIPPQEYGMGHDATIDIPLEQVTSNGGGLRSKNNTTAPLEPSRTNDTKNSKRRFLRGRRVATPQGLQKKGPVGYDGEVDTINTMGKIYDKILHFSVFTRYFLYVLPLALIIAVPIIVGATAAQDARIGGVRIVWFFTWIEVVWLSLWGSKIVAHYLPYIFQILAGVVSSGVRKYSLVIRALEIPISLVGWSVTSLATFVPIMTLNPSKRADKDPTSTDKTEWESTLQKVLGAFVVASLIYLVEKTIIQLISINYHRKQFNARIKASKRNVFLLGLLYDASRRLFPSYCNEFAEEDYMISDNLNISLAMNSKRRSGHARSGSHTPLRVIQDISRVGGQITSAFGNVAQEITGKEVFNSNSAHSIVVEALEKKRTSEALAKRIWMSFVLEGREALYRDDIAEVLGPDRTEEAEEAFTAIDADGNGDISLDEMILAIVEFSRERKAVASSMHDVAQAINVLDRLLMAVVLVAIVFVFIAFLNKSFVTTLATTGTALLSLSFVFSVSCQEVLGSCIFLFVKHPYDIGDRVDIGADQFVVEHISLLFTVFRRVSGAGVGRNAQVPNIVLNTLWIENVSRSNAMSEQLTIDVSFDTSFEDLQVLKNELQKFVTDKENSRDFLPDLEVGVLGTSDQSKLSLQVDIRHKGNWANETIRQARRSKFMCALVSALKAVPIYAPGGGSDAQGSAANPSYSVNVTDEIAKGRVADAAQARTESRLVPAKPVPGSPTMGPAGLTERQENIVEDLTARDPTFDPVRDEAWTSSREDTSTLADRPDLDQADLNQVKTLLHRGSTRGKRKPGTDYQSMIPTIEEPTQLPDFTYDSYGDQQANTSYGQSSTAYAPQLRTVPTQYQSPPSQIARSPSNPYRQQGQSSGTQGVDDEEKGSYEGQRPYSGV